MPPLWWLPIDFCRPWCAAMTTWMDWLVNSLILSFPNLRGLPLQRLPSTFLVIWFSAAYHDFKHGWIMTICDAYRSIVKVTDVRQGCWPAAIHIVRLILSVLYARHLPVAFVFKGLGSPLQVRRQHPSLLFIEQYWQEKWLVEFDLCRKTEGVVFPWYY